MAMLYLILQENSISGFFSVETTNRGTTEKKKRTTTKQRQRFS